MGLFDKTFELSMVKDYVSHWTSINAIRELIQNSLDSNSPFSYEFRTDGTGTCSLVLRSEFSELTPKTLLLGSTTKSKHGSSIGSFGEGYKIALLVLTREGHDVTMMNGDVVWRPRFRYSKAFGDELLVIDQTTADGRSSGLTVVVDGLDDADRKAIIDSCLKMQDHIGRVIETKYGTILFERPKKLYIGSLFICDTELTYGYDISPSFITLERDRQTVDTFDLKRVTLDMWLESKEIEMVANMIDENVADVSYGQFGLPTIVKEECYRIFKQRHPGALVAESQAQLKEMVEAGLTKTVYVGSAMYTAVSTAPSYQAVRPVIERMTPTKWVIDWESRNFDENTTEKIRNAIYLLTKESKNWVNR